MKDMEDNTVACLMGGVYNVSERESSTALLPSLENRALLCLAARWEYYENNFPRHGSVGLHPHPAAQV
jgi:hypothetical protein